MQYSYGLLGNRAGASDYCRSFCILPKGCKARGPVDAVMHIEVLVFREDEGSL